MKFLKRLYNKIIFTSVRQTIMWKFRLKYGISPKQWERLKRRHTFFLAYLINWETKYITFLGDDTKKRYEDYTNTSTHKQKIEFMEKENE